MTRLVMLLLAIGFATQSIATTLVYQNLNDLVRSAEAIVTGVVARVESLRGPDNSIYTFVTLDRVETVSGNVAPGPLTLRFVGGRIGQEMIRVDGVPEFDTNDEVLLFIAGNGRYMAPIVGWTQGAFHIVIDPASGARVLQAHDRADVIGIIDYDLVKARTGTPGVNIVRPNSSDRSQEAVMTPAFGPSQRPGQGESTTKPEGAIALSTFIAKLKSLDVGLAAKSVSPVVKSVAIGEFPIPMATSSALPATGPSAPRSFRPEQRAADGRMIPLPSSAPASN